MATKSRRKRNRRAVRRGLRQRLAVGFSIVVLVLCAASVGFSLFVRQTDSDGTTRALRLAVENGTGEKGIARAAEAALGRLGVQVISTGNAVRSDYAESILVARRRGGEVELLAERIGCRHVTMQFSDTAPEDATLVLGADFARLSLGLEAEKGLAD